MGMNSFYGGRQGASIVVVHHFDGVDIPQVEGQYVYKAKSYAVNEQGIFMLDAEGKLIEQDRDNFPLYAWRTQYLDGSEIEVVDSNGESATITMEAALAEGMRQCFEQGGETTDIVNYGECVIIDTIVGLYQFNNPDNGKVYRRGLNYNYDPETNPLAGAEYIGQIVGPQGRMSEMGIRPEKDIKELPGHRSGEYGLATESIVPGRYFDDNGNEQFNDTITYSWALLRDAQGNIQECVFGFTVPYEIVDFISESVSPYYNRSSDDTDFENLNLVEEMDTSEHPFFQQWKISVPKGIHGDDIGDLEVYPTIVKEHCPYWDNENFEGEPLGQLIVPAEIIDYNGRDGYLKVDVGEGHFGYIPQRYGDKLRLRYRVTTYDRCPEGDISYWDLGPYNMVSGVSIAEDGTLTVTYTWDEPDTWEHLLRWLDYQDGDNTSGLEIQEDGTIIVHYNTGETQTYEDRLNWVTDLTLTDSGDLTVLFNNNNVANGRFQKHIRWIAKVTISETGDIVFLYNDGTEAFRGNGLFKTINDVDIDTGEDGISGTQKVRIEYNTKPGVKTPIGNPLNSVFEMVITKADNDYDVEPNHLLVLYTDPASRNALGTVTYYSTKLDRVVQKWHDLGITKGIDDTEPNNVIVVSAEEPTTLAENGVWMIQTPAKYVK